MNFSDIFANFTNTEIWRKMAATVENSPWHREESVAKHTEMTLEKYLTMFMDPLGDKREHHVVLTALLYHDVGKPNAEEIVIRDDGSTYRRYGGHEALSAMTFMDQYVLSFNQKALGVDEIGLASVLSKNEARAVKWLIEHHLPYGLKNHQKLCSLKIATKRVLGDAGMQLSAYYNMLRSDCHGRISDDHAEKIQAVEDWIVMFDALDETKFEVDWSKGKNTAYILIGPSGSGKSTFVREHQNALVISADDMKQEFFLSKHPQYVITDPRILYADAWQYTTLGDGSVEFDRFFKRQVEETLARAAAAGFDVFFDLVNSTKKRRASFINSAQRAGFKVMTVEFWNRLETVLARQNTRADKSVPAKSVEAQFWATQATWQGVEAARVITVLGG